MRAVAGGNNADATKHSAIFRDIMATLRFPLENPIVQLKVYFYSTKPGRTGFLFAKMAGFAAPGCAVGHSAERRGHNFSVGKGRSGRLEEDT